MKFPKLGELLKITEELSLNGKDYYLQTYPVFIKHFKDKTELKETDVLTAFSFAYSWMPTIPKLKNKEGETVVETLKKAAVTLNKAKKKDDELTKKELEGLSETFNNSIVGVSKMLHFINPDRFPIWDSNVVKAIELSSYQLGKVDSYFEYRKEVLATVKEKDFDQIWKKVNEKLEASKFEKVGPVRALEFLLYLQGKKIRQFQAINSHYVQRI